MNKMKVYWLVHDYPYKQDMQGGIFYKNLAEAISKEVNLTVIAPIPYTNRLLSTISEKWKTYFLAPKEEVVNNVRVIRPRYFAHPKEIYNGIPHFFMYQSIKALNLEKPDLVHTMGGYPVAMAATELALKWDVPIINTFIGSDVNEFPDKGTRQKKYFKFIVDNSSANFTVSNALAVKFRQLTGKSAQCLYLPFSGNDVPAIDKIAARKKLNLPGDKFIILYAGYLYESKGAGVLIDALRSIIEQQDVAAVFCGGKTSLVDEVNKLPNAQYVGQLPIDEVLLYMKAADVLVLPSFAEGIPGVIKEAGMCELPVIATNVGGIPEMLSDKRGYMIEPRDSVQLKEAILAVKNNYSAALNSAQALKEFVQSNFNLSDIASQVIAEYKKFPTKK